MKRREFITLGGASLVWPLAARAQKAPTPVIGFLDSRSSDGMTSRLAAFRQGLKEVGLIEGENVTVIYRWAEDRVDRLPEMASELARQATVIVTTGGPPAAFAAKAATTTIPIVFLTSRSLSSPTGHVPPGGLGTASCAPCTQYDPLDVYPNGHEPPGPDAFGCGSGSASAGSPR
jgi:ABC-type uncharacterized transport system substrate-binding protein